MCKVLEISILESEHKKTRTNHEPIVESEPKTVSGSNAQSVAADAWSLNPIAKLNVQASPVLDSAPSGDNNEGAASAESPAKDRETRFVVGEANLKLESLITEIKKAMHCKIFVLLIQFLYLFYKKVLSKNKLKKTKKYCWVRENLHLLTRLTWKT